MMKQKFEYEQKIKKEQHVYEMQGKIDQIKSMYEASIKRKQEQLKVNEQIKHSIEKQKISASSSQMLREALKKKHLEKYLKQTTIKQKVEIMSKYHINQQNEKIILKQKTQQRTDVINPYEIQYQKIMPKLIFLYKLINKKQITYKSLFRRGKLQSSRDTVKQLEIDDQAALKQIQNQRIQIEGLIKLIKQIQND